MIQRITRHTGSYMKLLPTLRRFPEDIMMAIDDDVCYHSDMMESLYEAYSKNGEYFVYCRRSSGDIICVQ